MRGGFWGNPPPENFEILKLGNATFIISFFCFLIEMGAGGEGGVLNIYYTVDSDLSSV